MVDQSEAWTDSATVGDESRPLLIDAEIKNRQGSLYAPKVRCEIGDRAVTFGRRALEIAIVAASNESKNKMPRQEIDGSWTAIRDRANDAEKAVRGLLFALNPYGKLARTFQRPLSLVRVGNSKFRTETLAHTLASHRRAKRDALILIAAQKLLAGVAIDSERRRVDIVGHLPAKSSDVVKHAFVFILYEAWIFLMGVRPGSSPVAAQNPFLQFVEAAWQDWQGIDAIWKTRKKGVREKIRSFVRSLNVAQSGMTEAGINRLLATGPGWL